MSNHIVDNLITVKILYLLVTPFTESNAFKSGVIDANGNVLIKPSERTQQQKESYGTLDRLVFSLKKLLAKLPGGDNRFKSIVAAYWLVKEAYVNNEQISEELFLETLNAMENGLVFIEEELEIEQALTEDAIANVTGTNVSTDVPLKPLFKKKIFRRKQPQTKI
jgi:hypothetical protein